MTIRRNTLFNLAGAIIPMVVMLVTVPLYLKVLGDARYGVLALVWVVLGYFSFLEMGLGKATANQIAKVESSATDRSEIFWAALMVNASIGLAGAAFLWFAGEHLLISWLNVHDDFRYEITAALPWMIATFPIALVSSVFNGALEGTNRFLTLNLLQVTTNSIFQVAPLAFAYWLGPSLTVVIPVAVVSRAAMNLFFFYACYKSLPLVTLPRVRAARVKALFAYGGWVAVTGVAASLLDTVERPVIGAILGPAAVTHYTVPMQLVGKIKVLPGSLSRAMFPAFSSQTRQDASALAISASGWLAATMAVISIVCALALRPFLDFWVGSDLSKVSAPIGEMLLIGVWANSVAHVPYFFLQASGRPDLVAKIHAGELLPYILLTWWATDNFGLPGAAAIWVLRCAVEALLLFLISEIGGQVFRQLASAGSAVLAMITFLACFPAASLFWRGGLLIVCVAAGVGLCLRYKIDVRSATSRGIL